MSKDEDEQGRERGRERDSEQRGDEGPPVPVGNRPCQGAFYEMLRCVERNDSATKCKMETTKFLECENYHFKRSIKTAVMYERSRARERNDGENEEEYTLELVIPTPVNPFRYYKGLGKDLIAAAYPERIYEHVGRIFTDLRASGEATVNIVRRFFRNED